MEVLPKLPAGAGLEQTGKWQKTQNRKATEGPGLAPQGACLWSLVSPIGKHYHLAAVEHDGWSTQRRLGPEQG